jgi:4-carboxymuconolactone decarboxylase
MADEELYQRGLQKRRDMLGVETETRTSYLKDLAPDLERVVVENLFGGIYCRPAIEPKVRSLCTITVLAALGHQPQLRAHIGGALNMGASKEEIVEVLMQLLWYVGLPPVSTALGIAGEVFKERGL